MSKEKKYLLKLDKEEANFILYCRKIKFGELGITLFNGRPHICKEGFKNVRFDYFKEFDKELDNFLVID